MQTLIWEPATCKLSPADEYNLLCRELTEIIERINITGGWWVTQQVGKANYMWVLTAYNGTDLLRKLLPQEEIPKLVLRCERRSIVVKYNDKEILLRPKLMG